MNVEYKLTCNHAAKRRVRAKPESESEWMLKKSEKFGYPRLIGFLMFRRHFCSFFVPFGNYSSSSTQIKEYWLKPIAFSGVGFWTYYIQNPKLSDRLRHTIESFSSPSSSRSSVQNMEDSWELVSVPTEIQHSMAGKETPPDGSETSLERNDGNSRSKVFEIRGKFFNESSIDVYACYTSLCPVSCKIDVHWMNGWKG